MKRLLLKYFIVFISFTSFADLFARIQSVRFNHIDVEDGLSENMARAILQDSEGFIWIATWNGLNRYDGYEFKVFKHIDGDSTSLQLNKITCVLEDHAGRLWVGTFGGGLSLFNKEKETFTNFVHDPQNKFSISSDQILTLFEDSKNRIWVGTNKAGVSLIDNNFDSASDLIKNIRFVNFINDPNSDHSIAGNGVRYIIENKSNRIWFGSNDGSISKLVEDENSDDNYKFINFQQQTNMNTDKYITFMIEDKLHPELLWLIDFYNGLIWFNTRSEKFMTENPYFKLNKKIPIHDIQSILISKDGEYLLGTAGDGIYSFNPKMYHDKNSSYEHLNIISLSKPFSVDAADIATLYEDASGLIWLGTRNSGVFTYQKRAKEFVSYDFISSQTSERVLHVVEDKDGILWIGTNVGLKKYDPNTQEYIQFTHNPSDNGSINSNVVYTAIQDTGGIMWIGTDKGLDKYNPSTNTFEHFFHDANDKNSISKGLIINTFVDSKGTLWIGGWGGGLNKPIMSPEGKVDKFLHYTMDANDSNSISDNSIMSFAENKDGTLWVGTAYGGLNKLVSDYDISEDGSVSKPKFISYLSDPNDPNSISGNDVRNICIDKNGTYWIATYGGGLNRFNPPKSENDPVIFKHYRESDGLANDVVKSVFEDNNGRLWISTAYGLSMFHPGENSFSNFFVADGLKLDKFGGVYHKSSKTGRLYFGGDAGLISFLPENIKTNDYKPNVVITSFKRYNAETDEMIAEKGVSEKKQLSLSYQDNILSFEFTALDFFNSSKNSYAYKLEGYNDNWIQLGNKRDVTFTNLDPGSYTLFVKGANNDGVWSEKETAIELIITPPWWWSNLAFVVYGILFFAGVFVADRIMSKRVVNRERNRAKLHEAELIKNQAAELETVDRLVRVINRAEDLETLFNSLLEQTMSFIPNAEKAGVFLLDKKENLFKVAYTAGYNVQDLQQISFTNEELKRRYSENSEEVEKGIYIVSNTNHLFGDEKLSGFGRAKSMLIMAVERDNVTESYVVFDNFSNKNAFDRSAARLLNSFREHAVSAIAKAQAIKTLQDKNEELIKTQEKLITQEKLASLGALTAGIAHEIKNPLNFVNNFSEVSRELLDEMKTELQNNQIKEAMELFEDLNLNLEKINLHGKRADSIIKGMLLHSRGSTGEKTLTDINDLLDQYVNLAYHGMRAQNRGFNIAIEKDYDETLEKIYVVPQDISRVFLNLINNACYAAYDKLKLGRDDSFSPSLKASTKNLNEKIEIRIRDNGNGISKDILDKIFHPFFTTKPTGEGTGLGLSLSYDVVTNLHSGKIDVDTKEGEFTEFILTLPKS